MPGLCVSLDHGWLEIDGNSLATPAIFVYNLWELIFGPDLKGTNGVRPAAPGAFANPMRPAETSYDLPIAIAGEVDVNGTEYPEGSTIGFERNIWWLRENIIDPSPTAATKPSIFHTADGLECTGEIQVLKLVRGQMVDGHDLLTGSSGLAMNGVLRVKYPYGGPIRPSA